MILVFDDYQFCSSLSLFLPSTFTFSHLSSLSHFLLSSRSHTTTTTTTTWRQFLSIFLHNDFQQDVCNPMHDPLYPIFSNGGFICCRHSIATPTRPACGSRQHRRHQWAPKLLVSFLPPNLICISKYAELKKRQ